MSSSRKDRSRSPTRPSHGIRRREKSSENRSGGDMQNMGMQNMNQMMMQNMYQQGNLMMGGLYPNMMMSNPMMGNGMIPNSGSMDMMSSGSMEMMAQPPIAQMGQMDMSTIPAAALPAANASVDMSMMGGMMMDSSMMGIYPSMGGEMGVVPEKKEIVLKFCTLSPPDPGTPAPPRRVKPPGCRTIFVGGLPEKTRESVVREIFELYGRIHTLRLSKKNFCHIRFDRESSVDAAMILSGYKLKLTPKEKNQDDMDEDDDSKDTTGWIHVDYALSRDDQNEFERLQRQAMRVQQQQMEQLTAQQEMSRSSMAINYRRSPSPVRVQPFSNGAIIQLQEKVKSEDHFASALPTLVAWLERGECSKKNSNQFYSMIQATNSHIRRIFNEKVLAEDEWNECKERIKNKIEFLIDQLEQVAKVFVAATHQRVWDHFTKPQRKNIETWQKMTQEFPSLKDEFNEKFNSEDYDSGMSNSNGNFKNQSIDAVNTEEILMLKRENESLLFQLEAYKNEVDVIKNDAKKEMEKFQAQFIARQALKGHLDQPPIPSPVVKPPPPPPLPEDLIERKVEFKETIDAGCGEAKLIGVMSAFLQVHPQGASLDYVVSYVRALFPEASQASVHRVLQKHPDVFQQSTKGVGANIETRWNFTALQMGSF